MEVDCPSSSSESCATENATGLKRSNSAPMLAPANSGAETNGESKSVKQEPVVTQAAPPQHQVGLSSSWSCRGLEPVERVRRMSTSSASYPTVSTPIKIPSRLHQIKHEETQSPKDSEAAKEREYQTTMQLSQSWEDLSVNEHEPMTVDSKRPRSFQEPLQIFTSFSQHASSPSPNRSTGKFTKCPSEPSRRQYWKQCFSPSLQRPVVQCPTPSPSPTRKPAFRRSLSPIVVNMQPSRLAFSFKRKLEDSDLCTPAKRSKPNSPTAEVGVRYPSYSMPQSLDDSSNSCPSMDSPVTNPAMLANPTGLLPSNFGITNFHVSPSTFPSVSPAQPSPHVFSFRGSRLNRDSLECASQCTPPHSSETSDSTENGDAMVTDDSGCDTSQPTSDMMMEEGSKCQS